MQSHFAVLVAALGALAMLVPASTRSLNQFTTPVNPVTIAPGCLPGSTTYRVCGPGTVTPRCPVFACSNAFASVVGCGSVASTVAALALTNASVVPVKSQIETTLRNLCTAPTTAASVSYVLTTTANSIASATAAALYQYRQVACTTPSCVSGVMAANGRASIQSVARATTSAFSSAVVSILGDVGNGCDPADVDFLIYAEATSYAISNAVATATTSFFTQTTNNVGSTTTCITNSQTLLQRAVAEAVVCVLSRAFGLLYTDPDLPSVALTCQTAYAYAGVAGSFTANCPLAIECPSCDNAVNLVQNGGFETGDFSSWTLGGNTGFQFFSGEALEGNFALYSGAVGSPISISQPVSLEANQYYSLSFWLKNLAGSGPTATVSVSLFPADGSPAAAVTVGLTQVTPSVGGGPSIPLNTDPSSTVTPAEAPGAFGWTNYQYNFLSSTTALTLKLDFGIQNNPSYFVVDAISISCATVTSP